MFNDSPYMLVQTARAHPTESANPVLITLIRLHCCFWTTPRVLPA